MNVLEQKFTDLTEQQFNIKLQTKDSFNCLRSKNGNTFKKLMNFMSHRIKSKESGEQIKRFCDSIKCQNELKTLNKDMEDLVTNINNIRNKLLAEEQRTKTNEIKVDSIENREFVSIVISNAIEKICAKNKLCTQLKPNLQTINETITSYENLFTNEEEFGPHSNHSSDDSPNVTNSGLLNQISEEINELMTSIESILYDLNHIQVYKPIKISIDSESVLNSLVETTPEIQIKITEEEREKKVCAIASKLITVQNLMKKYQTIRSDKLSKNKEKLEKVIHSCDEFIQQNV